MLSLIKTIFMHPSQCWITKLSLLMRNHFIKLGIMELINVSIIGYNCYCVPVRYFWNLSLFQVQIMAPWIYRRWGWLFLMESSAWIACIAYGLSGLPLCLGIFPVLDCAKFLSDYKQVFELIKWFWHVISNFSYVSVA